MNNAKSLERYLVLFLPWGISMLFASDPMVSYFVAWLGSFFIFFVTLTGWVKPIPADRTVPEQLMRPIFIIQIIFAGYMSCTSIFYFLNVLGYEDFAKVTAYFSIDQEKLKLVVQCQRYYCLGHASFVTGILVFMKYPVKKKYKIETDKLANLLLMSALIAFPVSL